MGEISLKIRLMKNLGYRKKELEDNETCDHRLAHALPLRILRRLTFFYLVHKQIFFKADLPPSDVPTSMHVLNHFTAKQASRLSIFRQWPVAILFFSLIFTWSGGGQEQALGQEDKQNSSKSLPKSKPVVRANAPCLRWLDDDVPPRAVILCVHGLGLHNGTYADFGKRMARLGYAVYAIDMRGFGSFQEASGLGRVDFDGCLADIKSTLKVLHRALSRAARLSFG